MRKTRFLLAWAIKRRTDEDFFRKRRLKVETQNKLRFNKLTQYQPMREKLFSFFSAKKLHKTFGSFKNSRTFATAIERESNETKT